MSDPEKTTEVWVYAGKRLSSRDTLLSCWLPPQPDGSYNVDDPLAYAKFGANCIVGGKYEITVIRTSHEAGGVQVFGDPVWKSRSADAELQRVLFVADNAHRQKHAKIRHHKNEAKVDEYEEAMKPLLAYAKSCRTGAERDALIATTMRRLGGLWF